MRKETIRSNERKMNRRAIVSFANTPAYIAKMDRLSNSLYGKTDADFFGFTSYEQIGCKPHEVVPYQFKPYAIQKVIEKGYTSILWCDSPVVAVKDLGPVFNHIEEHGYVFFDNIGHPLGKWTNDKALKHFNMGREFSMNVQMIMACCMGLDFKRDLTNNFFDLYRGLSDDLYPGSWSDHRHDQTVASFLINSLGLQILNGQQTFFMYENHRFAVPINEETICLISR